MKYPQADLSKLPEDTRFPLLCIVITPDVLFGKDGIPLNGITFLKKFMNLHQYGPKGELGFSDTKRLLVKVSVIACEKPDKVMDFLERLEKNGFEEYFDQALFEVCFIGDDEYAITQELPFQLEMLRADLFLSADDELVRIVLAEGFAAATTFTKRQQIFSLEEETICNFTFDFDGVVGDAFSDEFFEEHGLTAYNTNESDKRDEPLTNGPLANFAKKIMLLRSLFPEDVSLSPVILAINTVRGSVRQMRVLKTMQAMGISPDKYCGTCGEAKGPILHASGADIFFDDSMRNVTSALKYGVFAVHVPFGEKNKKKSEPVEDTPKPCQKTVKAIQEFCEGCDDEEDEENTTQTRKCENCTRFGLKDGLATCVKCGKPSEKYNKKTERKKFLEQVNSSKTQKSCENCSSFFTASDLSLYCIFCGKTANKTLINFKFYCHECNTFVPNSPNGKIICTNCNIEFVD